MTEEQQANEIASIAEFVDETMAKFRKKNISAAVTNVIRRLAMASADMSTRKADGSIDKDVARDIMYRAVWAVEQYG